MKFHKLLATILLSFFLINCATEKEDYFTINDSILKAQYTNDDFFKLEISNIKSKKIDSVVVDFNSKKIGSFNSNLFSYNLKNEKLGYQYVKTTTFFEGNTEVDSTRIEIVSNIEPKLLSYAIVNTFPHDTNAYTQGLEFFNDVLYEGTGQKGESSLRKTDYKTGKVDLKIDLDARYFGEGITFLNGKIYQLTWQETTAIVYDALTMKKLKEIPYTKKIEGWGLTNDGKSLYQSDGSEKIYILNPTNFEEINHINVYAGTNKIKAINELEWVNNKIYGNVYQKDAIAVIDPKTGKIEAILDLSKLKTKISQLPDTDVLNGIAYNPKSKTFFVTGKNWDKMFEIRIN